MSGHATERATALATGLQRGAEAEEQVAELGELGGQAVEERHELVVVEQVHDDLRRSHVVAAEVEDDARRFRQLRDQPAPCFVVLRAATDYYYYYFSFKPR